MRDKEKQKAYMRVYNAAYRAKRGEELLAKKREQSRAWRAANRETKCARSREYYQNNKEKALACADNWRKRNLDKSREISRRRRVAKAAATPNDRENRAYLRFIKAEARHRRLVVDHVIPIQGRGVCGLNVYWNTQLLTPQQNCVKHNHYEDATP